MQRLRTMQALLCYTHIRGCEDTQQSNNKQLTFQSLHMIGTTHPRHKGWLIRFKGDDWHQNLPQVPQQLLAHCAQHAFLMVWRFAHKLSAKNFFERLHQGLICGVDVTITQDIYQLQHCLAGCCCNAPGALLVQKHAKSWVCKRCRQGLQQETQSGSELAPFVGYFVLSCSLLCHTH